MKRHILPILLIATTSFAIYANTLKNGFVYDDDDVIVNIALIRNLNNLPKLLDKDYFALSGEATYRPIVTLTYFFDYALCGLKPWGYHVTNIFLHMMNGILLYIFLTSIIAPNHIQGAGIAHPLVSPPFLASLLFVTHPILTEAVNAISFREDLLAFLFYIATFTLYLRINSSARTFLLFYGPYLISCLLFFLSLLSKEMAVTLPLAIYCYESIYLKRKNLTFRSIILNPYIIGYISVTLIYLYIRFIYFQNLSESEFHSWITAERFMALPWLLLSYLKLIVFPVSLSADYEIVHVKDLFSFSFIIPFLIIVFLLAVAFKMKNKEKTVTIAFGVFFFIITLIPVYNLIPLNNPMAERYLYLPLVGVIIVIASVIHYVLNMRSLSHALFVRTLTLFIVIVSIYSVATVTRNKTWRDSCALWSDTLRKMPNSSRAHNGVGFCYYRQGLVDEAIQEFRTALKLNPINSDAYNNLGSLYADKGMINEAIVLFKEALEKEQSPALHYNLGNVYADSGRLEEAIFHYMSAIRINPYDPNTHYNLANTYYKAERFDESIREYKTALHLNPNFVEAHFNLGTAYIKQGLIDEARMEFKAVLTLNPGFLPARQALKFTR